MSLSAPLQTRPWDPTPNSSVASPVSALSLELRQEKVHAVCLVYKGLRPLWRTHFLGTPFVEGPRKRLNWEGNVG
eukprot:13711150-Alexandrium_andersonii.AAC.1